MYARLTKGGESTVDDAAVVYALHRLAGLDDLVLSLWETQEQAAADPTAEWYEVENVHHGGARDAEPAIAALAHFDGPMSDPLHRAASRANDERVAPLMTDHAGTVRAIVLWQPERQSMLVAVLATSVESIEDGQRIIMSSELLPGEDLALLTGPDRIDLYRVSSSVPAS